MRIASLTILCLALAAIPAFGQGQFYDNGPINGTTDAWTINFGFVVSDTFFTGNYNVVTNVQLGVWEFPGDSLTTLSGSITDSENSPCPSELCLGTFITGGKNLIDTYISTNQFGYNVDTVNGLIPGIQVPEGVTLWLNIYNAGVASGNPVYWDENRGAGCGGNMCPSSASESSVGTIPSEAFTLYSTLCCGPPVPEPGSILLFGSGILGLVGLLRSKLF